MKPANWIDFSKLSRKEHRKTMMQPLDPKAFALRLADYFQNHTKYNIYSLALYVGMSDQRFTNHYLKSPDKELMYLAKMAVNMITSHCLENEEEYSRSMRYIMARQNTGKDFIELDESVKNDNSAQIIILPAKDK